MLLKIILFIINTALILGIMFTIAVLIDAKESKHRLVMEEMEAWKEPLYKEKNK